MKALEKEEKLKISEQEKERRRKISEQAQIIVKASDGRGISSFAKELNEKWINGEITKAEEKRILFNRYNKKR